MPFCKNCGEEHAADETVCGKCQTLLSSEMTSGPQPTSEIVLEELQASKILRIVAGTIDLVIVAFLSTIFLWPKFRMVKLTPIMFGINLSIPSFYLAFKDSIDGKSVGKLLTGLTVFNRVQKKPIGFAESVTRNWYLAVPFFGPTLLSAMAMAQILLSNQRWGDRSANTLVIQDSKAKML
jgi:uncharacterized RDD family membrane protein YckC